MTATDSGYSADRTGSSVHVRSGQVSDSFWLGPLPIGGVRLGRDPACRVVHDAVQSTQRRSRVDTRRPSTEKERPMSFNVALGAGVSSASLHALASIALEQPAAHSGARTSAASVDDVPPCGTPTPGHPPIPHGLGSLLDKVALNPQPLPPKETSGAVLNGGKPAAY